MDIMQYFHCIYGNHFCSASSAVSSSLV